MKTHADFTLHSIPPYGTYLFFVITLYLLVFEDVISDAGIPAAGIYRNLLPLAAVLLFLWKCAQQEGCAGRLLTPFGICGIAFVTAGMTGWIMNRCQTFSVTLQGMHEHLRFWLCLYLFLQILRSLSLSKYGRRLFIHIAVLSVFFILLTVLDMRYHIWPRQMYRYGTSSIQLFFSHPSKLGARAVFLIAMLGILHPYLEDPDKKHAPVSALNTVLMFLLLGVVFMTLRVRLFGFILFFLVLYLYMILLKKRLHLPILLAGTAGAVLIGWRRFYDFYFSPIAYYMARGQLAANSVDLARQCFPFGGGFGSFGSRTAQTYYSPLYYKYLMMTTSGLTPEHPYFACDSFFPAILGETGWLGLAAYAGLVLCLLVMILKDSRGTVSEPHSRYAVFTGICLLAYELLEATGTLSFSEHYSVLIALALALALCERGRRTSA